MPPPCFADKAQKQTKSTAVRGLQLLCGPRLSAGELCMENYVAKHDKLMRLLQMRIESATPEHAVVTMPLTPDHRNGMGFAHGGAIFSLADVAFGAAANAGKLTGVVSLSTAIEFLRPGKTGPLRAEAIAVRRGAHIQSYDVMVYDSDGSLIARCMASGYQTDIALPA